MSLRKNSAPIAWLICLMIGISSLSPEVLGEQPSELERLRIELATAMEEENLPEIQNVVKQAIGALGDRSGVPEVADRYIPIPARAKPLTRAEAAASISDFCSQIERRRWWRIGLDPTKTPHALREVAGAIDGLLAIEPHWKGEVSKPRELALEGGDFLVWAQEEAEVGCFPFPAIMGIKDRPAFASADKMLRQSQKNGTFDQVVRNGWIMSADDDGGLQFDTSECGVALLNLYERTGEEKYRRSALKAAKWAMEARVVPNWNYNSFSVALLVRAFEVSHQEEFLHAAIKKAKLGVIPGQLKDGPFAGRWFDPHNARPPYHFIMLRALATLANALPADHADRKFVIDSLRIGFETRGTELLEKGAMDKDNLWEYVDFVDQTLSLEESLRAEPPFLQVLERISSLIGDEARRGKLPLGARAWGQYLRRQVEK